MCARNMAKRSQTSEHEIELLGPSLIHELRQPLLGVKAGLEMLGRKLGAAATGLEDWALVTGQVARLEELCQSYQTLYHPERATVAPFEAEPVVRRAIDLLRFRLRRLESRFTLEFEAGLPKAYGVPQALTHAVQNLVVNALEALDPASTTARLAVRVLRDDVHVQVRVSDEGSGVPAELAEKIFEPRFTTKSTGNGLGLYVCRRMMKAMGGEVRVVPPGDPKRLLWARTEMCIDVPPSPERLAGV
jgi:signal transduction histidine kinase